MIQKRFFLFLSILTLLIGCKDQHPLDDLNTLKQKFLNSVLENGVEDGIFNFSYTLRTVFFSKEIVSLFGAFNEYSHQPHGQGSYEGKTFYKINGRFKEITLDELFSTSTQKAYLRSYCEEVLKKQLTSYISNQELLFNGLQLEDMKTFVINNQYLIIIFQPYVAGSYAEGPFFIKIPYTCLKGYWNESNAFFSRLDKIIASQDFITSWDVDTH